MNSVSIFHGRQTFDQLPIICRFTLIFHITSHHFTQLPQQILPRHPVHVHLEQIKHQHRRPQPGRTHSQLHGTQAKKVIIFFSGKKWLRLNKTVQQNLFDIASAVEYRCYINIAVCDPIQQPPWRNNQLPIDKNAVGLKFRNNPASLGKSI